MRSCRISKQVLASLVGTITVGGVLPPSGEYLLWEGSGRGPMMSYKDSGLSTAAIAAAVIQLFSDAKEGRAIINLIIRGTGKGMQFQTGLLSPFSLSLEGALEHNLNNHRCNGVPE
ncbi:hypothetical protein AVEN_111239-1 [Araneus ventricosus]|uniref:Uncharacterized protein n=1 Tax=Araneus ventricosus TaxID=182803 RepID=A0A4Y2EKY7_ARAVE|nr:hypothetical protein AVEN_111239-1 [Araneus ventricosus]